MGTCEFHERTTDELTEADFVVVADLPALPYLAKWYIYLHGGNVITVDYLTSRGSGGACIIFKPAVQGKSLKIWVSAVFAERNQNVYDILDHAISLPNSKWSWFVGSNVEFLQRALKTKALLGIVAQAEFNAFPKDFVKCMPADSFLNTICDISPLSQTAESRI